MSPSSQTAATGYRGSSGQTARETTHIGCECGFAFAANIHRSINIGDNPELLEQFYRGELDRTECPDCARTHVPKLPRTFHEPRRRMLILELPREFRHRELQLTAELLVKLDQEGVDIPAYAKRPRVAYGRDGLRDLLSRGAQDNDPVTAEAQAIEIAAQRARVSAQRSTLTHERDELHAGREALQRQLDDVTAQRNELETERAHLRGLALDLAGRASPQADPADESILAGCDEAGKLRLADRPTSQVDEWRAGDAATGAFLHQGHVLLTARLGRFPAELSGDPPLVRMHLHELAGRALIALSVSPAADRSDPERALFWGLDPRDSRQRAILDQLSKCFEICLDLYDEESRPVASWKLRRPLRDNVALALGRADEVAEAAARTGDPPVSTASLLGAFDSLGPRRLAKRDPYLHANSFADLPSPAAAALGLGVVEYWLEPDNEAHLLLALSFPQPQWYALRRRVVQRAVDFGLRLSPALATWAISEKLAQSRESLLEGSLRRFREVCRGEVPNDLDPLSQWQNWRELLIECLDAQVPVDTQTQAMFRQSARQARQLVRSLDADPGDESDLAALDIADRARGRDDEEDVGDIDIVDEVPIEDIDISDDLLIEPPNSPRSRTMEVREEDILERESSEASGD